MSSPLPAALRDHPWARRGEADLRTALPFLTTAVVMWMWDMLRNRGGADARDHERVAETLRDHLPWKADALLRGGAAPGVRAELMDRLAHAVATHTFLDDGTPRPGGFPFAGLRFGVVGGRPVVESADRPGELYRAAADQLRGESPP